MSGINIKAYAKINLALDITGRREDGFHTVDMVMQLIDLHDDVLVRTRKNTSGETRITLSSNKPYLPTDITNIAYKAAALMVERYRKSRKPGVDIRIDIKKRIFVSAGLAGGSTDAAAVILGLNHLWDLKLSVKEMCDLGAELGSDVPFCIMGQAKCNKELGATVTGDSLACTCAAASGTGTELTPVKGLDATLLLSKPPLSISTKKAYEEIDAILEFGGGDIVHPDVSALISALAHGEEETTYANMMNLFELYTVCRFSHVEKTKTLMEQQPGVLKVLMSGTGPTVFSVYKDRQAARTAYRALSAVNKETCLAHTLPLRTI